ncbi:MAG: hypothetical protein ACI8ZM_004165 [Crocinitomix sp.]|jgi:hypothetical protein
MKNYKDNIILIGPLATGKSFIAEKLSLATSLRNHPADKLKWYYRHQNGYSLSESTQILRSQGFEALINYAQQYFGAKEIKHLLRKFKGIVDLGASDTHCQNLSRLQELNAVLEPFQNIFLILPSKDEKESIETLNDRLEIRYDKDPLKKPVLASYLRMNEIFVKSESTKMLAKHIIYTSDRPIEDIGQEILMKSNYLNYETAALNLQRVS